MKDQADKQQLLLEYLLSSPDTYTVCQSILKPDYFDPEYRKSLEFVNMYYDQYHSLPSLEQIYAETKLNLQKRVITSDQVKYTTNEIEAFCRQRAVMRNVYAAPELAKEGRYNEILEGMKEAILISLNHDLGLDYFDDPLSRLEELVRQPLRTPMGFSPLDNLMNGGLARGEVIMFCANSGVGKSITLANLAYNFVHQGKHVVYISLELPEQLVAQRFDIMFSGIPSVLVEREYQQIAYQVNSASKGLGRLVIKYLPSDTNANQLRAYLKEYELKYGRRPDSIILDYLDKMGTNQKMSYDNIWVKDKYAAEQLDDLGKEYNAFIATASQLNRGAIEAEELNQGHTAGGLSKVNTVDWQWAIVMTGSMKAEGVMMFTCLKSRSSDAVGKTVPMKWDNKYLRILNPDNEDDDDRNLQRSIERKSTIKGLPEKSKRSILDIMDT
jgi:archaellum biogenesis ATPase FlaH